MDEALISLQVSGEVVHMFEYPIVELVIGGFPEVFWGRTALCGM